MVEWKLWTLGGKRLKWVSQICHVSFLISVDFSSFTWKIKENNRIYLGGTAQKLVLYSF